MPTTIDTTKPWVCTNCSHHNSGSNLKCAKCDDPHTEEDIEFDETNVNSAIDFLIREMLGLCDLYINLDDEKLAADHVRIGILACAASMNKFKEMLAYLQDEPVLSGFGEPREKPPASDDDYGDILREYEKENATGAAGEDSPSDDHF